MERLLNHHFLPFFFIPKLLKGSLAAMGNIGAKVSGLSRGLSKGAGNKINPSMLMVSDIYKTKVDPLAKVMRTELKKRRIKGLKVVYSVEKPIKSSLTSNETTSKRSIPGSNAFVPSAMGLIIASEVVKDITGIKNDSPGV